MTAPDPLAPIRARVEAGERGCEYLFWQRLEDQDRLLAALDAVMALHQSNGGGHHTCKCGLPAGTGARCIACRKPWPCQTVAAVSAALGGEA